MVRNVRWIQFAFVLAGVAFLVVSIVVGTWAFVPIIVLSVVNVVMLEGNARRARRSWREQGVDRTATEDSKQSSLSAA
jgi:hypothetical protein